MNNLLVIGDIHGEVYWKKIIDKNPAKNIVFLGDYCDSHTKTGRECIDNMIEIFDYARANPDTIHLCIGNHDYHYLGYTMSHYSGFNWNFAAEYQFVLKKNLDLMTVAYLLEFMNAKVIVSHAGVSQTFLDRNNLTIESFKGSFEEKPEIFDFVYKDEFDNTSDPYGDDVFQSPIWIRPSSLQADYVKGYHQIVGHTYNKEIVKKQFSDGNQFISICTHDKNNYYLI